MTILKQSLEELTNVTATVRPKYDPIPSTPLATEPALLAEEITEAGRPPLLGIRQAVVSTVDTVSNPPSVGIKLGGTETVVSGIRFLSSYRPKINDTVMLLKNGASLAVLGLSSEVGKLPIVVGPYGSVNAANPSLINLGENGTSPDAVSYAWGDNTGWRAHFGTSVGGVFTPRVTIKDTGNVGIGTSDPLALVHIHGQAAGALIDFENNTRRWRFINSVVDGSFRISDITAASFRIHIDTSGNVGVGMIPTTKLDVSGTFRASGAATLSSTLDVAGNTTVTGNLGVGMTPSMKLDVNGTFRASGAATLSSTLDVASNATVTGNLGVGSAPGSLKLVSRGGDFDLGGSGTVGTTAARVLSSSGSLYLDHAAGGGVYFRNSQGTTVSLWDHVNGGQFRASGFKGPVNITDSNYMSIFAPEGTSTNPTLSIGSNRAGGLTRIGTLSNFRNVASGDDDTLSLLSARGASTAGGVGLELRSIAGTTACPAWIIGFALTTTAHFHVTGNITAGGTISARRYKKNIKLMPSVTDKFMKLEFCDFLWDNIPQKGWTEDTKRNWNRTKSGVIADQADKVFPHLVSHSPEGQPDGFDYIGFTAVTGKVLQDFIKEVRSEIAALKQRNRANG